MLRKTNTGVFMKSDVQPFNVIAVPTRHCHVSLSLWKREKEAISPESGERGREI